jgi:uncharacterized membrane protein YgdD (TMEM256/DUF423 family)
VNDNPLARRTILIAGILGAVGIVCASFSAHGLENLLVEMEYSPELIGKRLDQFDVGVRYHLLHTVALVAVAAVPFGSPTVRRWASRFMIAGIVLFSGSLYALVLTNRTGFGMVTPLGGLCWIVGWLALIGLARRSTAPHRSQEP